MSNASVKVIQVGCGGFGRYWRRAIQENGCQVVAVVDAKAEALEESAAHWGLAAEACLGPDGPWESLEADLVVDATPHPHHLANARRAFGGGKDLVVVKPMALTEQDCHEMVRLAEQAGRKLAVGQQLRFHPVIMKLRELVQGGAVGDLGFAHLDWFRTPPDPKEPPLFCARGWSQPYPMVVEGAIHLFDYLRWVTGCDPVSVWGQSFNLPWSIPEGYDLESAPQTCAYAEFEMARPGADPLHVCFRSIVSRVRQDSWLSDWHIEGDRGSLLVRADQVYLDGEQVEVGWDDGGNISDLRLDRLNALVLRELLRWREGGPEPGFSGRNNLPSLGMVFGLIRSWQTGERISL